MGRKTYAERNAAKIQDGISPSSDGGAEPNPLDSPDVQAKILRPEHLNVTLDDGTILQIVPKLTLGQIYEKKVTNVIRAFVQAVFQYGGELTGDIDFVDTQAWLKRNSAAISLIAYKEPIVYIVSDFLALVTKKPVDTIRPYVNQGTVQSAFILALQILNELVQKDSGDSQEKNVS
jgi:hypothetical protein